MEERTGHKLGRSRGAEVLDQENFVPFFAVNELIHKVFRQQDTIAAWTKTVGLTDNGMANWVIRGVIDSRVVDFLD